MDANDVVGFIALLSAKLINGHQADRSSGSLLRLKPTMVGHVWVKNRQIVANSCLK